MIPAPLTLRISQIEPARRIGRVCQVAYGHIESQGPLAAVGDICEIECRSHEAASDRTLAEVASVNQERVVLVPLDPTASIEPGANVVRITTQSRAPVGEAFAGRAIGAMGSPIDGGGPISPDAYLPLHGEVLAPLDRKETATVLETGIKAIDGPLTLSVGQRIGIFAASGVGKTTLIGQLADQIDCDHCILCLVGERGREVEGSWRRFGTRPNAQRYSCVAATSDVSPALRARAVHQALAMAEYWRGLGRKVVLIIDSVTRYAMALRDIGLASGAPPTVRAYTPNVFSSLPRMVERCGAAKTGGSISAIITVLSETDDVDDPIVEVMKSLLDGHIVLSRQLADQGHFPAIDLGRSVSRQSDLLMTPSHLSAARKAVALLATYDEAQMMIESGIYKAGSSPRIDEAIRGREMLLAFLKQDSRTRSRYAETVQRLQTALGGVGRHA